MADSRIAARPARRTGLPRHVRPAPDERVARVKDVGLGDPRKEPAAAAADAGVPVDPWTYSIDVWQRSVLFWDTLRQRADEMLEHEKAGMPPVLAFEYETLLDARRFERPANYTLLRITAVGADRADHCLDPDKPPVVVIDPRAGHGPGIGGFKRESEVGIALHEGHPVYFVAFSPTPCPGQTLVDVLHAMRRFTDEVIARHAGKLPVLYGNCQAGWAAMLVAIHCRGPLGPVVLNGSPLSYWAGEPGANPMRLMGGLLGGSWIAHFLSDLGDGRFDGAWLVQNFEALKPENALWEKYAKLFLDVDRERERFLEFERWWGGFHSLSREEIVAIVEHLFIGNELETGALDLGDGVEIDLKRLRSPLVVFASHGDNITPPHQALGWLRAVYRTTEALKRAGQRIVYLINPHVGHLGIFVSASVARFEHRAILESLDEIEALAPGLYEMKISNPTGDPDCRKPQYSVAFEKRRVEDLAFDYPNEAFERVKRISGFNEDLYRMFVSPLVRSAVSPWSAKALEWLHPMRTSRNAFATRLSPWMHGVAVMAEFVRHSRMQVAEDDPSRQAEAAFVAEVTKAIEAARRLRDGLQEQSFGMLYGGAAQAGAGSDPARGGVRADHYRVSLAPPKT